VGPLARLCSTNPGKLRELRAALPDWRIELLDAGADEYPPEDGGTYYENARGKALFGRGHAEPEAWVLGEDSGLEVDGLDGLPGVRSARFGGDDPVARLLDALRGCDGEARHARYVCELIALAPDGSELRGTGMLEGRIGDEPRGSEGFGYDPVFVPDGEEQTVAQLGNDWKSVHSHRARAVTALAAQFTRRDGEV
jgi:XTP/dITP diphosphohydrolase